MAKVGREDKTLSFTPLRSGEWVLRWSDRIGEDFQFYSFKFQMVVTERGTFPLRRCDVYIGMLYDLIWESDPELAKRLHGDTRVKPWNFSSLISKNFRKIGDKKNDLYSAEPDTVFEWYFRTIMPDVALALMNTAIKGYTLNFGRMRYRVINIEAEMPAWEFNDVRNDYRFITVRYMSPVDFYSNRLKKVFPFTVESLLDFQLRKFYDIGLLEEIPEIDSIAPFIRIAERHLKRGKMTMRVRNPRRNTPRQDENDENERNNNPSGKERFEFWGDLGYVTFKITGDPELKREIYRIFKISEFTGTGIRTSSGLGHNRIINID